MLKHCLDELPQITLNSPFFHKIMYSNSPAIDDSRIPLKMNSHHFVSLAKDPKYTRSCFCIILPSVSLVFLALVIGTKFIVNDGREAFYGKYMKCGIEEIQEVQVSKCENLCQPPGSESLPKGIVSKTSDLERRPLWGLPKKKVNPSTSLFSAAVGIKQKEMVDKIVRKFLSSDFVVMLFHYDGILDEWNDLSWTDSVIHISAVNQTKWWFAKRFLHPDIVTEYDYIFIWDEDLGVENFNPARYLSIVKREGLEISQPALDHKKSEVHHLITARGRRSDVHRRAFKSGDSAVIRCDLDSKNPPCTGWIEVMAPVFSRAAWRCVWLMIQNDLIHAWGLDIMLGYCAQGDRTQNIGIVDAEYIAHYALPTLGKPENKTKVAATDGMGSEMRNATNLEASPNASAINYRFEVRRESYNELKVFKRRWMKAAKEDECWTDPYPDTFNYAIL